VSFHVRIRGDGVAARCCAHLLDQVSCERLSRPRIPVIMLSEAAQELIRDIFQKEHLFRDLPRIRKRVVRWGPDAAPVELDHSAVIVSEEELLDVLGCEESEGGDADWTIIAARPLPAETTEHRFGSRVAMPVEVKLKVPGDTCRAETCWMESVEDGWLFLNSGWLIAVGGRPEELLEKSRLVRDQIESFDAGTMRFPSSPRMATPLGGERWICCGSAAMTFDPICGDGTAHAVREAILASAVTRAVARGEDAGALLAHYEARLTAGLERHLGHCLQFYSSGGSGAWWREQVESAAEGIAWCRRRMEAHGRFRYRLNGLELEAVE
jgi:hypothetical protein